MLESMNFTYDGVSSYDTGVVLVNDGGGLIKEALLPQSKVITKTVAGNDTPYFQGKERQVRSFPMTIFLKDWQERDNINGILRWLDRDYLKPLWVEGYEDRIMYAIADGNSELFHNGLKEGYGKLNMVTNSPYLFSQEKKHKATVNGSATLNINNGGDVVCKPIMKIVNKKEGGNISIKAYNEGKLTSDMRIVDLRNNEVLDIHCIREEIRSNLEYINRFVTDNHNDQWTSFELGNIYNGDTNTRLVMEGNFDIEIRYQYRYLI